VRSATTPQCVQTGSPVTRTHIQNSFDVQRTSNSRLQAAHLKYTDCAGTLPHVQVTSGASSGCPSYGEKLTSHHSAAALVACADTSGDGFVVAETTTRANAFECRAVARGLYIALVRSDGLHWR